MLTRKFEQLFDGMMTTEAREVKLEYYEVSQILALLKSSDSYTAAMKENLRRTFDKVELEL